MLSKTGDFQLVDFGLSRLSAEDGPLLAGTQHYVAPEALGDAPQVSVKADVWSAGVALCEALTGTWRGASAADVTARAGTWTPPVLPADIPAAFSTLLRLMLTVDPKDRPDCSTLLQHSAMMQVKKLASTGSTVSQTCTAGNLLGLPLRPDFVGREADLARLREFASVDGGAVIAGMRGMGGIGKSALALVLAHEWAPCYPDGQFFLNARGTQSSSATPESLLERVIHAYRPDERLPGDLDELCALYHAVLRGKRVLLLLDNARDAAQALPLIPPPGCALIITSRTGITLGTRAPLYVDRLSDYDAVVLLRRFVELSDSDVASIVKHCAGLPLALRLAGSVLALEASSLGRPPDVPSYVARLQGSRLAVLDEAAKTSGESTISSTLRVASH